MDDTTLKKLKKAQLQILDEIVRICDKHGITYFLISGTLLGAVRHKGYVPWDDDIDIVMPRKDYEKFKALAATELSGDFFFQDCISDFSYYLAFAKVRKNGTLYEEDYTDNINTHKGIFVDVLVLDNAKKQRSFLQDVQGILTLFLKNMLWAKIVKTNKSKTFFKRLSVFLLTPVPSKAIARALYKVMSANKNDGSAYFVNLTSRYGYRKQTMKKDIYLPASRLEFEGKTYSVPRDWDYVLKRIYGDYMKLPPENERTSNKKAVKIIV